MKRQFLLFALLCLCLFALRASATTYYVDINSPNPAPPYSSWSTAATNIQDAVAQTINGDTVLVNPGNYQFGGAVVPGYNAFRVVATNLITVQSVNGPASTYIWGDVPSSPNSTDCAYLGDGATLGGFTFTNYQYTPDYGQILAPSTNAIITNCILANYVAVGSGTLDNCSLVDHSSSGNSTLNSCIISNNSYAFGGILNNCILVNYTNSGSGSGVARAGINANISPVQNWPLVLNNCLISNNVNGPVYNAFAATSGYTTPYTNCILNNCTLARNSAISGPSAASGAEMYNCLIISNSAASLANSGAASGFLVNCTLIGNSNSAAVGNNFYGTVLTNCTLTGNSGKGAAAASCTLDHCTLLQNWAGGASGSYLNDSLIISNLGGGVLGGVLTNCIIAHNVATNGGGAYESILLNCTVVANGAVNGGGIFDSAATNCIIYYNTNGDFASDLVFSPNQKNLSYCCASAFLTNGFRNITNAPLLVNLVGGDYHLQPNSPCINSGDNAAIHSPTDLDGNPRIQGGTVDMGAYEYQTPTSVISYAYLQQYGLPTDGSVDFADLDGTAFDVYQDWIAGLNPTNPASVLAMLTPVATNNATGVTVTWQSVPAIPYFLQRSTNLDSQSPFMTIAQNISGKTNTTSYTDTSATGNVPYFYRVGVIAP